jgi:hypothetical protein
MVRLRKNVGKDLMFKDIESVLAYAKENSNNS